MYIDKIPAEAKQIANSYDYIDPRGNVYGIERRNNRHKGQPFIKTQSTIFGYKYCGINYRNGQHITKRVHKLVAEAFIPNPTHLPIVLHKDNNKKNNQVSNLKWGTIAENMQQAFDDGLCVNAKGFDDNQSIPCDCYDSLTNQLIDKYGSVSIATQNTGITKGGILYQLNNPNQPIRKAKYFVLAGQGPRRHDIIVQYNKNGDEINRFTTIGKASLVTGIPQSTISRQVSQIQMPNWTKEDCYFKKLTI